MTRWLAVAGGLVLVASGLVTIYSIVALQLLGSSFPGDVEIISYSLVISVFLFLPYSQFVRGHVIVDLFTINLSFRTRGVLDAIGALLFAALAAVIAWRMTIGGTEMFERGQTTSLLKIPYWWSFPLAVVCLSLLVAVSLYTAWQSFRGEGPR
jgi:TRAP-type C4-dicarboxylate transport system permease small subunit